MVSGAETVPHPADGLDQVRAQLLSEIADVDVDHVGARIEVVSPHVGQDLLAGEYLVRMAEQELGEAELPRRQLDLLVAHPGTPRTQIECHVAHLQLELLPGPPIAQTHLHPRQELLEAERLGHVVVGTSLEARHRVLHPAAGGQDDHRHPLSSPTDLGEHLVTVEAGEAEIEDEEIEVVVPSGIRGGAPVLDDQGAEARRLQALLEERRDPGLVFSDQYAAHVSSSVGRTIVNLLPRPTSEWSSRRPPCPRAMASTMGKPSPAPLVVRRPT